MKRHIVVLVRALLGICAVPAAFAVVNAVLADEPANRPLIVGHRGLVHAAPENTLAGFRACLALRIGFEFDVRQSQDGTLVCIHDASVDRTTDAKKRVSDIAVSELRKLDAGNWFDPVFRGERVPTVEEVFDLISEHGTGATLVAVDLKDAGAGIEERLVRMAEQRRILDRLVFIGLAIESADVRGRLKAASAKARVARLAPTAEAIDEVLRDTAADWVYVRFLPASKEMAKIRGAGKRAFIAGPRVSGNEPGNWSQAATVGIDAILTDYPLELRAHLKPR